MPSKLEKKFDDFFSKLGLVDRKGREEAVHFIASGGMNQLDKTSSKEQLKEVFEAADSRIDFLIDKFNEEEYYKVPGGRSKKKFDLRGKEDISHKEVYKAIYDALFEYNLERIEKVDRSLEKRLSKIDSEGKIEKNANGPINHYLYGRGSLSLTPLKSKYAKIQRHLKYLEHLSNHEESKRSISMPEDELKAVKYAEEISSDRINQIERVLNAGEAEGGKIGLKNFIKVVKRVEDNIRGEDERLDHIRQQIEE
ncbi:hypothetical protein GKQ38_00980 [Candidatus Nanohaloarchaea archaeon]|nr:hypothetical protein GKQ38_00980 [Candidatus Nanohaloarchaea archaeon]